ncbi:MAG: type II toxin-antitoxin system Phd/YefM family antitoxin [Candidatus Promineifilaceae bacterium]
MQQVTFSHARTNFATIWDHVIDEREPVTLTRRGHESVTLMSTDDYSSLMETLYLLSSPVNAERLLGAIKDAKERKGTPQTLEELKREVGFNDEA